MFKRVTLELSLKPFIRTDAEYIREVAERIFEDWTPLIRGREEISIMLWCSDGSEILEYRGNEDDSFEWCYFLGTANLPLLGEGESPAISLHERAQLYTDKPVKMTYGILKNIVSTLKEVGRRRFPKAKILIGETFDIGPEFAKSDFKYGRHKEITQGSSAVDKYGFIDSTATLHGDSTPYAAYPHGIPEGEPFGRFLGRQAEVFLRDLGFDYLWLSNGLGFSADPWKYTGKIFDGKSYHPERLADTRAKVFDFWRLFRSECSFPVETRGTNNSAGIDYASDGVPLYDIYSSGLNILPPPNSPWAAINGNYGLELMGHMTRICQLPQDRFLFRFYLHDPWWVNSPWYDRYGGSPMDIYMPMAISRINEGGKVESAGQLNILSIDNSFGKMPELCIYEPLPHFLKAEKNSPDAPAPFVWVYPLREYTQAKSEDMLRSMMNGDRFIEKAINGGFPLNCVVSSDIFRKTDKNIYSASVLISPVPYDTELRKYLTDYARGGGKLIIYGGAEELPEYQENGICTVDISLGAEGLLSAIRKYGYTVEYSTRVGSLGRPVMTVARSDGGLFFSSYSIDTTAKAKLKLPLGAPVFIGCETEIEGGCSVFRLARWEHRECRVLIEQEGGVVSCNEIAPVNRKYRRKLSLAGLENATVRILPEAGLEYKCAVGEGHIAIDGTPKLSDSFVWVTDEVWGTYLEGRNISGSYQILFEYKD